MRLDKSRVGGNHFLLHHQGRPEIRITFANQLHSIIPNPVADPIVRWPADRLAPDRRRTASSYPLQQPSHLERVQVKHMCR